MNYDVCMITFQMICNGYNLRKRFDYEKNMILFESLNRGELISGHIKKGILYTAKNLKCPASIRFLPEKKVYEWPFEFENGGNKK